MIEQLRRYRGEVEDYRTDLEMKIEEATLRGELPMDDLAEAVLRCTGCTNADGCDHWLDDHANGGAEHAPEYCRNARQLEGLRVAK